MWNKTAIIFVLQHNCQYVDKFYYKLLIILLPCHMYRLQKQSKEENVQVFWKIPFCLMKLMFWHSFVGLYIIPYLQLCSQHNCLFSCETLISDWLILPYCDPACHGTFIYRRSLYLAFLFFPVNLVDGNVGAVSPPPPTLLSLGTDSASPRSRHALIWTPTNLPKVSLTVYPWMKFFPGRRGDAGNTTVTLLHQDRFGSLARGTLKALFYLFYLVFYTLPEGIPGSWLMASSGGEEAIAGVGVGSEGRSVPWRRVLIGLGLPQHSTTTSMQGLQLQWLNSDAWPTKRKTVVVFFSIV